MDAGSPCGDNQGTWGRLSSNGTTSRVERHDNNCSVEHGSPITAVEPVTLIYRQSPRTGCNMAPQRLPNSSEARTRDRSRCYFSCGPSLASYRPSWHILPQLPPSTEPTRDNTYRPGTKTPSWESPSPSPPWDNFDGAGHRASTSPSQASAMQPNKATAACNSAPPSTCPKTAST
jgi:hypothetical protein